MKQRSMFLCLFIITVMYFIGCEESPAEGEDFHVTVSLSGAIQKGPFLNGTSVLVTELNSELTPTGRTFTSQIENNAGLFQLPSIEYSSKYVELKADGFYFDEIQNESSSAPLTLYAISDITYFIPIPIVIIVGLQVIRFVTPLDPKLLAKMPRAEERVLPETRQEAAHEEFVKVPLLYSIGSRMRRAIAKLKDSRPVSGSSRHQVDEARDESPEREVRDAD